MTMRSYLIVATAATVLTPIGARAQQTPATDLVVQVGIVSLRPDGSIQSSAYSNSDLASAARTQLFAAPCGIGSSKEPPELAFAAWRIESQVMSLSAESATVRVTWQRVRSAGQVVTEPSGSVQLTLKAGDRSRLDEITVPAAGECPTTSISLEARYDRRLTQVLAAPVASDSALLAGGRGGGGRVEGPRGMSAAGSSGGGGGGRSVSGRPAVLRAELWLVHSVPDKDADVLYTTTMATPSVGDFAFAPITIQTSAGVMNVRITGTLELGIDQTGEQRFVFGATRRVAFTPANRPARENSPSGESGGVAKTIGPVPGPDEVLSFEMPLLQVPGGPSVPDRFAIRVRLTRLR